MITIHISIVTNSGTGSSHMIARVVEYCLVYTTSFINDSKSNQDIIVRKIGLHQFAPFKVICSIL